MTIWRSISFLMRLLLLIIAYLIAIYLIHNLLPNARIDLTENKLFTLSDGTKEIINNTETPIKLTLFYSEKEARPYPQFRQYAERVIEKISEYAAQSHGKIQLQNIDPESYSEAEDSAIGKGITAIPLEDGLGPLYFGISAQKVATSGSNKPQTIAFIKPESEQFLEYELSKLIQAVQVTQKPKVAVLSEIPIFGDTAPSAGAVNPAWVVVRQLSERYDVIRLSPQNLHIPDDVSVLWVMHPKNWPASTNQAIKNYVQSGRHAVFLIDPYAESIPTLDTAPLGMQASSDMPELFMHWGIAYNPNYVVLDSKYAWLTQVDENQLPKRNPALISLPSQAMNRKDIVTSDLDRIVMSSAGSLSLLDSSPLKIEPLLQSSEAAKLIPVEALRKASENPEQLLNNFVSAQEPFVLAARFTGSMPNENSKTMNFIVIADTDFISDRLWVLENTLFGQSVYSAQASNGDFFYNTIDQLSGSNDLISIRSRGMVSRPFEKVDQIRRVAEQKYRNNQELLTSNLEKTQNKLDAFQTNKSSIPIDNTNYKALLAEKIKLRKQLRYIQHESNADVDRLGKIIKVINIFAMPLILFIMAGVVYLRRKMRTNFSRIRHGTL